MIYILTLVITGAMVSLFIYTSSNLSDQLLTTSIAIGGIAGFFTVAIAFMASVFINDSKTACIER